MGASLYAIWTSWGECAESCGLSRAQLLLELIDNLLDVTATFGLIASLVQFLVYQRQWMGSGATRLSLEPGNQMKKCVGYRWL